MAKRVIICGYPKSGNTWLTRLTAEIIGCPVAGFWCEPFNQEIAIEGLDRPADYLCFKAHHSLDQIKQTLTYYANGSEKIIYVIRDPRDVIVSASYHLSLGQVPQYEKIHQLMSLFPTSFRIYQRLFHTQRYKLDALTRIVLDGRQNLGWLGISWQDHVVGYLNSNVLVIQYEALQADPMAEAKRICTYLNISRSDNELREAIQNQSFNRKKKWFLDTHQFRKAQFLRQGTSGAWTAVLTEKNIKMIDERIGNFLGDLGYP